MSSVDNSRNTKQDVEIAEIKTDISWIKQRLNHLGDKINWILWILILGTLLTITIQYLK